MCERRVPPILRGKSEECFLLGGRGQLADQVEVDAAQEGGVVERLRRCDLVPGIVSVEGAVDWMVATGDRGRQLAAARLQRWHVAARLETEARLPGQILVDPRLEQ